MQWDPQNRNQKKASFGGNEALEEFLQKPQAVIGLLIIVIGVVAVVSSVFRVQPEQQAVVTRFGRYNRTLGPGLNFKIPFGVEQKFVLDTGKLQQETFGFRDISEDRFTQSSSRRFLRESSMLTGDLNVADVEWVVQYYISDPRYYLFNVEEPEENIRDIGEAVMRRVVGDRTVNDVLTVGRGEIADTALELMQEILDRYRMGVRVDLVKLQDVNPPEPVKPSFNAVNAAKQEQEREINLAEANYNKVIPRAIGQAEEEIQKAEGYAAALINRARGEASRFEDILKEYEKAPEITTTRLYLELVEELLQKLEGITVVDPAVKGVLPIFQQPTPAKVPLTSDSRASLRLNKMEAPQ